MDRTPGSPRSSSLLLIVMFAMIAIPAALTLHTARVSPQVPGPLTTASPYGYSVSLLMFLVPSGVILFWLAPAEHLRISKRACVRTIAVLFPLGAALDFFFARIFLVFPNPAATLGIPAPAIGGSVPIEEYLFYLTGFTAVLMLYIWLDEYWLAAYSVPVDAKSRVDFARLLQFHPQSLIVGIVLIAGAILFRKLFVAAPGFPGYFIFLVVGAVGPSALLFRSALPVINWRALSLTFFFMLLLSLLWEATLGLPYGWWGFREEQMLGIFITAWSRLPIEEVLVWSAVSYATAMVYEVIRRWQASGRSAREAFLGAGIAHAKDAKVKQRA